MPLGSKQFSLQTLLLGVLALCMALAGWVGLLRPVQFSRDAAIDSSAAGPFAQLLVALHNYHDEFGSFPPAYIADASGKPMHSWRVLLLPYIEEQALYDAYDFSEPWDGPNNSKLAARIPRTYNHYGDSKGTINTSYVVIVGAGTAFPGAKTTKLDDFKDGTENSILIVEIARSNICWMEPRDFDLATMSLEINDTSRPSISSTRPKGPYVVFADTVRGYHVKRTIAPEDLRSLFTIAGGEKITRDMLVNQGDLK